MKTDEVICMELTRTIPSRTPLFRTASATCGVMFSKAILDGIFICKYWVCDFILFTCLHCDQPPRSNRSDRPRPNERHRTDRKSREPVAQPASAMFAPACGDG